MELTADKLFEVIGRQHVEGLVMREQLAARDGEVQDLTRKLGAAMRELDEVKAPKAGEGNGRLAGADDVQLEYLQRESPPAEAQQTGQ